MARQATGSRNIPGTPKPGSKPAGSRAVLPAGTTTMSKQGGPNMHRQKANTSGGPGVNVNSQPVK